MDHRETTVVGRCARALCSSQDYHSLLSTLVAEMRNQLGVENAIVWIRDDERDALCCEASRHSLLRRNSPSEVCADDAGTLQDILKSGDTRIIQPGGAEQRSVVEGEPVRTAMFAPIRH